MPTFLPGARGQQFRARPGSQPAAGAGLADTTRTLRGKGWQGRTPPSKDPGCLVGAGPAALALRRVRGRAGQAFPALRGPGANSVPAAARWCSSLRRAPRTQAHVNAPTTRPCSLRGAPPLPATPGWAAPRDSAPSPLSQSFPGAASGAAGPALPGGRCGTCRCTALGWSHPAAGQPVSLAGQHLP